MPMNSLLYIDGEHDVKIDMDAARLDNRKTWSAPARRKIAPGPARQAGHTHQYVAFIVVVCMPPVCCIHEHIYMLLAIHALVASMPSAARAPLRGGLKNINRSTMLICIANAPSLLQKHSNCLGHKCMLIIPQITRNKSSHLLFVTRQLQLQFLRTHQETFSLCIN
jgi:hypothetical protein